MTHYEFESFDSNRLHDENFFADINRINVQLLKRMDLEELRAIVRSGFWEKNTVLDVDQENFYPDFDLSTNFFLPNRQSPSADYHPTPQFIIEGVNIFLRESSILQQPSWLLKIFMLMFQSDNFDFYLVLASRINEKTWYRICILALLKIKSNRSFAIGTGVVGLLTCVKLANYYFSKQEIENFEKALAQVTSNWEYQFTYNAWQQYYIVLGRTAGKFFGALNRNTVPKEYIFMDGFGGTYMMPRNPENRNEFAYYDITKMDPVRFVDTKMNQLKLRAERDAPYMEFESKERRMEWYTLVNAKNETAKKIFCARELAVHLLGVIGFKMPVYVTYEIVRLTIDCVGQLHLTQWDAMQIIQRVYDTHQRAIRRKESGGREKMSKVI